MGKLVSWKGCYTLLYAAKLLKDRIPGLRITLVGRGEQREGLEKMAALLGISDRISLPGFFPYEEMPAFYAQADVFALPALPAINLAEQFGFVVAETMACGLPTVVSRVGGLPEVVDHNADLLFTPGDYHELAKRLLALYENLRLHQRLSAWCLERAHTHYDARKNGEALRSRLLTVLKQ